MFSEDTVSAYLCQYAPCNSFRKVTSLVHRQTCVPQTQKVTKENVLQEIPNTPDSQLPRLLRDAVPRVHRNNETPPDLVKKKKRKKKIISHCAILQVGGRPQIPSFPKASPDLLILRCSSYKQGFEHDCACVSHQRNKLPKVVII